MVPRLTGLRVLVVEDDRMVREVLGEFLTLEGAVVLEAASASAALDVLREDDVDVVLTDLGLPDISGEAIIAHVRLLSPGRTAVVVMSGAGPSEVTRARALGAERVFPKPLEWTQLVAYLERRRSGLVDRALSGTADAETIPMRVLIIEDDVAMRALLRDVLMRAGYGVIERGSGADLTTLVEREVFDAVVLDKEMPGVNGLELLSFLRHRLPAVPVIFVTAFGGPTVAEEAARRGAFCYLEKPFRVATVLDTLAAVPQYRVDL
jgi:DNA-binding NtrC family response regulator